MNPESNTKPGGIHCPECEKPLQVKAFRSLDEAASLKDEINALNRVSRRPSPFHTFEYLVSAENYDEHTAAGQETLLLVAFERGRIIGYLPLVKRPSRIWGFGYVSVEFLSQCVSERPYAVARSEDEERCCAAFYTYLFEVEKRWSVLQLGGQDQDSKLLPFPEKLSRGRFSARYLTDLPNCTIPTSYESLHGYTEALGQEFRRNITRRTRKLLAQGNVESLSSSDPHALPQLLDIYLDIESKSWKSGTQVAMARNAERIAFFRSLLPADQPMAIGIRLILLDGVPIAGLVYGTFQRDLYLLEIVYREDYRDFAPGNLIQIIAIHEAIEKKLQSCNLLASFAYYKSHWLADITETQFVQIFRVGSLRHLAAQVGDLRKRLRPEPTETTEAFNRDKRVRTEELSESGISATTQDEDRRAAERLFEGFASKGCRIERLSHEDLETRILSRLQKRAAAK